MPIKYSNSRMKRRTNWSLIARDLSKVQGIQTVAVDRILEQARQAYDKLEPRLESQVYFQVGKAELIKEFGETYVNLGDLRKAEDQALEIRSKIAARDPDNPITHRDLASSNYNLGDILVQLRNPKDALERLKAAAQSTENAYLLARDAKTKTDLKLELAQIYYMSGKAYEKQRHPAEREESQSRCPRPQEGSLQREPRCPHRLDPRR